MLVDMLDQAVRIFAHFEEVCFFFCRCTRTSTVRTFTVHKLGLGKEGFARSTVHSFIVSFINVSLIIQLFEDLLHLFLMVVIRCTDKMIV